MKALVAYGTKFGSTAKVAEEIASVLRASGCEAEARDLRKRGALDLDGYGLVVLGSSIVMNSWSRDALRFLERNRAVLARKKVALFACCGNVLTGPARTGEYQKQYLEDVAARFGISEPVALGLFGGEIDFGKYGFLTKAIVNSVWRDPLKDLQKRGVDLDKPYDFRDWDAIRSWANSLNAEVKQ